MLAFAIGVSSNRAFLDRVEDVKATRLSSDGGVGVLASVDGEEGDFKPA